ncbi:MAG: cellulase family glycosylhydrolase [Spirochaetales bacterium]|nr:cellulase family glycosylhydrolase [Spirochaetales bacterium]
MKNKLKTIFLICLILLLAGIIELSAQGFSISGKRLIDANGNEFIIRGISHAHCWYTDKTSAIADIAYVGANTVRLVCSNGVRWTQTDSSQLSNIINLCKQNKLIAMPEVHDTTGYGEEGAACTLSQAVNYWRNMQSVLNGQEAYVLINIGNEPYGNNNYSNWVNDTKSAIQSMRSAGFNHTLVVDAPNWGQDWSFTMRDNAQSIFDADPARNTLLSVHMYGVFDTASEVQSYVSNVTGKGLPLIIGEFGHNHSDGNPDEDAIMSNAQSYGIGYMGWSWCGNSSDVSYLDMVNSWNRNSLTSWGDRIINGANGLKQTSQICSVYSGATPTPSNPPTNPPGNLGDTNGDNDINIVDALLIAQYYVGLNPSNFIIGNADTNCDGTVNIVDALLVAQYYVGLITSFC